MFRVDLHTHSNASTDGGISPQQYQALLEARTLDYVAVTDHNSVAIALKLQELLGERIIVGEEIMTSHGELIGLFLTKLVEPYFTPIDTAKAIRRQGGLVYVPHPLETVRHGLSVTDLDAISQYIDIVEVHNGRALFQSRGPKAAMWAKLNQKVRAASSDAHGLKGVGAAYTLIDKLPTKDTLLDALAKGRIVAGRPPLRSLLYPKAHRLRHKLRDLRR